MGYTISFSKGRVAEKHDKRIGDNLPKNIDSSLTKNNRDFTPDRWKGKDYRFCFNEYFQQSVDANNAKQKREARKIHDYYSHIEYGKGKQKQLYEYVLQIGNHGDDSLGDSDESKLMRYALEKTLEKLPDKFPNFGFVLIRTHADEPNGSYHAHICFFPHANGYKTGMPERCALKEAFKQMGYDTTKGARYLKDFKQTVEEMLENEMLAVGLERAYGDGGFSDNPADKSNRHHMLVPDYKLYKDAEQKNVEADLYLSILDARADTLDERESVLDSREEDLDKREASYEAEIEDKYEKAYKSKAKDLEDDYKAKIEDKEDELQKTYDDSLEKAEQALRQRLKKEYDEAFDTWKKDYKNELEQKFQSLQDKLEAQKSVQDEKEKSLSEKESLLNKRGKLQNKRMRDIQQFYDTLQEERPWLSEQDKHHHEQIKKRMQGVDGYIQYDENVLEHPENLEK